jgi:hypothetical protein
MSLSKLLKLIRRADKRFLSASFLVYLELIEQAPTPKTPEAWQSLAILFQLIDEEGRRQGTPEANTIANTARDLSRMLDQIQEHEQSKKFSRTL